MRNLHLTCGAALAALLLVAPLHAAAPERITRQSDVPPDYEFHPLPPGEGVDVVYYSCNACHSLKTVTNGGYSRQVWDELLDWMVEEQGMAEPAPDDRKKMLEYLATHIGEDWKP
jgi:hypothetical protein